jgi:hypothetical protein
MADLLRLVEDLLPLIDAPTAKAVETLQKIFGAPKVLELSGPAAKRGSGPIAWPMAGVVITPGVTEGTNTISIYVDGVDGFQPFRGSYSDTAALPADRREVRDSLGDPSATRTNPRLSLNRIFGARQQPEWDRYDEHDRVIHFEYDASRRVKRITLTSAPAVSE